MVHESNFFIAVVCSLTPKPFSVDAQHSHEKMVSILQEMLI